MYRRLLVLMLLVLPGLVYAQKWKLTRYEASAGIGFVNYFGDVGGSASADNLFGLKDLSILSTRPSFVAMARYKVAQDMAVKLHLGFLWMSGNDKGSLNGNLGRNYSFNTIGFEHTIQFEYSFLAEDRRSFSFALFNRRGMINNYSKMSAYLFAGIGGLAYKPYFKGELKTTFDKLDGGFHYAPVGAGGVGVKYIIDNYLSLGLEFGGRYLFADNIEGISKVEPDKAHVNLANDIYYFGNISIIYRIKTSRQGYPILFRKY